jgi:hypothetical protein
MNKITSAKLTTFFLIAAICILLIVADAPAQATTANGTATAATTKPVTAKPLSPVEEYQAKLGKLTKSPAEFMTTLTEFINKFPYSERAYSYFYSLKNVLKNTQDAKEARNLIEQMLKNTEGISSSAKMEITRHMGDALYIQADFEGSAQLAQQAIIGLDENAYVEFKRKQSELLNAELLARDPKFKLRPFNIERTRESFIGQKTGAYNLLAKSLWELGRFEQAEKAYRDSFAVKVSKESALGIARSAEKNGLHDETLKYATVAALTGKLDPAEMTYFYSAYAKLHQGKTHGVDEYLDTEFKKSYRNPVKSEKYKATARRSDRVVLAEFFTGAGCVPCIPYDYTFEKVIEDYSEKDVAVLAYHWHAPTMDPLGNHSADSRVKYYGINSAPNLFIDGKKFEKDFDYNGASGEQNKIQQAADAVNTVLKDGLETVPEAGIDLKAKRSGQTVAVEVEADKLKTASDDITLHIALVENEATYSGENGLRFHIKVVRALAGDNEKRVFGFKVDPSKPNRFEYIFDVYKVVAQNFAYYDAQTSERMKEFVKRMGGKIPEGFNIDFKFKYAKNQIDSSHLSVIAFLQDNKTKKILQSSVVNLASK